MTINQVDLKLRYTIDQQIFSHTREKIRGEGRRKEEMRRDRRRREETRRNERRQ